MLNNLPPDQQTYIVTGYTDLRRSIDGLATIVQAQLQLDPYSTALFLFCGRRCDRIIRMISPERTVNAIIALPDNSKGAFIGLTGENCHIIDIKVKKTGEQMNEGSVRTIVSRMTYIDRLESDIPNLQIDHRLSAYTEGIAVSDELRIDFHTMSLPSADLVWHCPYIVIFYSEDHMQHAWTYLVINGEGYYADPTWALRWPGDPLDLPYFLMTGDQRDESDCKVDDLTAPLLPRYWVSQSASSFTATDDTYSFLPGLFFQSLDEDIKTTDKKARTPQLPVEFF